jgi:hypothetical protein
MAPSPLTVSTVPVAALVMRAYWRSALGKAITGSDVREFCRMQKASIASFGRGPPLYPEFFLVNLNSGAAIIAKFLMCVLKKLHSPTKDRMVLTSVVGFAF